MKLRATILFFSLLLMALGTGHEFSNGMLGNPAGLSAADFTARWQDSIRAVRLPMAIMGNLGFLLLIMSAVFARRDRPSYYFFLAAILFWTLVLLVTFIWVLPINRQILTWSATTIPANWDELRDYWWWLREIRLILALIGFCLLLIATVVRRDPRESAEHPTAAKS